MKKDYDSKGEVFLQLSSELKPVSQKDVPSMITRWFGRHALLIWRLVAVPFIVWAACADRSDLVAILLLTQAFPCLLGPDMAGQIDPLEKSSAKDGPFATVTRLSIRSSFIRRLVFRLPSWMTPNAVTVFRTLLTVPILFYLSLGFGGTALALYELSMMLDFLDGAIAKNRGPKTPLGAFLDATADKAVNCSLLVWLAMHHPQAGMTTHALVGLVCFLALLNTFVRMSKPFKAIIAFLFGKAVEDRDPNFAATDAGKIKLIIETLAVSLMIIALWFRSGAVLDIAVLAFIVEIPFALWSFRDQCLN